MRKLLSLVGVLVLLVTSACLFDSSEDNQYEDSIENISKVVPGEIEQVFDNGFMRSTNMILDPFEQSDDGFYLIESPEMLDSVFSVVNYPGIDSLFPEDGMLLVLTLNLFSHEGIIEHEISFSSDTVQVEYTVRSWLDGPYEPFVWQIVFPIGITFEE